MPIVTKENAGKKINVKYKRDGKELAVDVQLNDEKSGEGKRISGCYCRAGRRKCIAHGRRLLWVWRLLGNCHTKLSKALVCYLVKTVHGSIGQIFGSAESKESARADLASVSGSVAGPIGILGVLFPSVVSSGIEYIIFVAALISLTLAVMNILPIPALDGGRWFTMTIFRLFKKDLTKEREENIQATGMLILLILTILVTISDVGKLF